MKLPLTIEPLLQWLRIRQVRPYIRTKGVLVDIGCDTPPVLIEKLHQKMDKCIGIDVIVKPKRYKNIELIQQTINQEINLNDETADTITLLAVLEHLKYPEAIVGECYRILKPKGRLLITVPAPKFLAKIGLVRQAMIDQHENYFTQKRLEMMLKEAGFRSVRIKGFELGFNTFAMGIK
jgi:2-polyprenyl-3-methyl-5-hydroxy-6-metoxy-1,4-benzoquinol methylase